MKERVPLGWLIERDDFLKPLWQTFSLPQQVLVKAAYGLDLTTRAEHKIWAVFNESCTYDELGYVTDWWEVPYEPQEYQTVVGLIGRRSGKSHIMSFMTLYEILFGGHLQWVTEGQDVIVPYVAQDLSTAKINMKYIELLARQNKRLAKEIVSDSRDRIEFKNGITVLPEPPTVKTGRGISVPVLVMDEVAYWYKAAENVNPDYEVFESLRNAQNQFPFSKRYVISTPYTEEGLLWEYWRAGTQGVKIAEDSQRRRRYKNTLVVVSSTAAFENPVIQKHGREHMQGIYNDNPEIFPRESLAQFIASESNFLPGHLIDRCTDKGVAERSRREIEERQQGVMYVAAMDPAFRGDSFAFTIGHMDDKGQVVQDLLRVWTPDVRLKEQLKPEFVMFEIGSVLKQWGIPIIYSDQYHMESLAYIARQYGFEIVEQRFSGQSKAKMYGSLEKLLTTQRIRLLDVPEIRQQLSQLNKRQTSLGNVQIGAPPGKHDDIATVIALMAHQALQYQTTPKRLVKEPTVYEENVARILAKQKEDGGWGWDAGWDY